MNSTQNAIMIIQSILYFYLISVCQVIKPQWQKWSPSTADECNQCCCTNQAIKMIVIENEVQPFYDQHTIENEFFNRLNKSAKTINNQQ